MPTRVEFDNWSNLVDHGIQQASAAADGAPRRSDPALPPALPQACSSHSVDGGSLGATGGRRRPRAGPAVRFLPFARVSTTRSRLG